MNVTLNSLAPEASASDLLAILVPQQGWEDSVATLDKAFGGSLISSATAEGFKGKKGQTFSAPTFGAIPSRRILLYGIGESAFDADEVKDIGGKLGKAALSAHASSVTLGGAITSELLGDAALPLLTEGIYLGNYTFDKYRTEKDDKPGLESLTFLAEDSGDDLARTVAVTAGVRYARDLVNEPPEVCTPAFLGEEALRMAKTYGFEAKVFEPEELEAKGMNLLLAVGRGAVEPSRLIHLTYRGKGEIHTKLAYVGKGVTFDTGGYSIKPSAAIMNMHCDMGGGAAVLGAAEAVGRVQPEGVEIHFIVPSVVNRVSSNAYLVNEIIKGYGGKTVEINNTDAEGRLILADSLAYAVELGVDEIINLATLTGACMVALGEQYTGMFSNNDEMADRVLSTAGEVGERFWRMPLDEKLRGKLKSPVADTRNTGDRWGGAITAALFLKLWVGDTAWTHLDIAGPAFVEGDSAIGPKGGTGAGVTFLTEYATRAGKA